jgi:hypothetical protein
MTSTSRLLLAGLLAGGIGLGTLACAGAPTTLDTVGRVDGTSALVAVVRTGDRVAAYVCDGEAELGERFTGTATGDHADLRSDSGATLAVDLGSDAAQGTFTAAGRPAAHFSTRTATSDEAGWFVAETGATTAAWVQLDDGTQTGVTGSGGHKHRGPRLHHHKPAEPAPSTGIGLIGDDGTRGGGRVGADDPQGSTEPTRSRLDGVEQLPQPGEGSLAPLAEVEGVQVAARRVVEAG